MAIRSGRICLRRKEIKDLRIVIPAYNEEASIGAVIDRVRKACPEAELMVVDDGSRDRTAEIAHYSGVQMVRNPTNLGYFAALKVGFGHDNGTGRPIKYFAFLDADGTYPPEKIPELYDLCKEKDYDIAVGSRLLGKDKGMPFIRMVGNRFFAMLASVYTGRKISDLSTGLRVFSASLLPCLQNLPNGLDGTSAMTMKALFDGLAYAEIPVEYDRRAGKSKLSIIKDGYRFLRVIMKATRKYRPVLFFCTLGIPFILVDFIVNSISVPRT